MSTRFRLVVVVSLFATLLLCALPSSALASGVAAKRAQARAVAAQVSSLDQRLNQTVAGYASAVGRLAAVQAQVRANRVALRLERYQLTVSQELLADHLVTAYKGGNAGLLNALFQNGNFDDLLTRIDYVQHLTAGDASMVRAIEAHRREVLATQGSLQKTLKNARQTAALLDAQRSRLAAQLSDRRSLLKGLGAEVSRLVAQAKSVTPVAKAAPGVAAPSTAGDGSGVWWPLIQSAAAANGIWAEGLYRLMQAESGGSAAASNGVDYGLFQYSLGTWKGSWNPWRSASIVDGSAQIKATALAIHLGDGPAWWPFTYPYAFSRQ
jgi:hypothetical protein